MVDPFSPEILLTFPLDPAEERRELGRVLGRLDVLNRLRAIACAEQARGHLQLAILLALETDVPVAKCLDLMGYMPREPVPPQICVELREAVASDFERAAEILRFYDAPAPRAAA
jgi:hypothetical protein